MLFHCGGGPAHDLLRVFAATLPGDVDEPILAEFLVGGAASLGGAVGEAEDEVAAGELQGAGRVGRFGKQPQGRPGRRQPVECVTASQACVPPGAPSTFGSWLRMMSRPTPVR